ncbi:uncharacterized protein BHQ10_006098 [Talaromyces amestolkiae]|uniref:O-methyltransferase C-terminal domain-containing protein n=1 Tax=Talaromyces amestolkiae TaxID=1196081 RepID=A0A364L2R0_TALAM|nr:uncharacterized protein BHQ10_006098 [Talaromyces amestolkiae]RAO70086.1 hypothetical protein BHQ10_006098 [Talaromyces amestolkiae]
MNHPTTLQSLSSTVGSKVTELSNLLKTAGLPEPSFAEKSYADFALETTASTDKAVRQVRNDLIDAAKDIIRLAMGPVDQVLSLAWSASDTANINIINTFSIAQNVPFGSSISAKDLSAATGLPLDELTRTVRYAITNGIFTEYTPGLFAHSAASAALARNKHLRDICDFNTDFLAAIQIKLAEALKARALGASDAPHAAFNVAYRTKDDLFEFFHKETDLNAKYHGYLAGRVNTPLWSVDRLLTAWDWGALGDATVVDCGGSSGHTCVSLAPICPQTKFIVQDMSVDAMDLGRENVTFLSSSDSSSPYHDLNSRITFATHNFFTEQKTLADVYIFRHILHDWDDENSVKIIKALVPALEKKSAESNGRRPRVLISEGIVPPAPEKRRGTLTEKMIRIEDSIMLAAHNARERNVQDFIEIFKTADPRFTFIGESSGAKEGAFQSLLEFEFV